MEKVKKEGGAAYGSLDSPDHGMARGWAFDPEAPNVKVTVELTLNGNPFETVIANGFRQDLQSAGMGDGRCSFSVPLPANYLDGKIHVLAAAIAGSGAALKNSPMNLSHADPPAAGNVSRFQRQMARLAKNPKAQGAPEGADCPGFGARRNVSHHPDI